MQAGLFIQVIELRLPCQEAGLAEGCESFDMLPSTDLSYNLLNVIEMLQLPFENLLKELKPRPNCIISDACFPWMVSIACKFNSKDRFPWISLLLLLVCTQLTYIPGS